MSSDQQPVIAVQGVSKLYHVFESPLARLRHIVFPQSAIEVPKRMGMRWGRGKHANEFWALRDVDLEVRPGEAVGILGRNGSGKSTLLQLIAGTLQPTKGRVSTRGRIAALLELGSGFNPEFTGRENVMLNGMILGLTEREVREKFDDIAAFADIGEFMEHPLKTYSSGMMLRLAFAVQTQIEPDVMIVDEALAVGDALFQKRCFQQLQKLRDSGCALLLVSHDQETVRTLTDRALLLTGGLVSASGDAADVVLAYRRELHAQESNYYLDMASASESKNDPAGESAASGEQSKGFGSESAQILGVEVRNIYDEPCAYFHTGDKIKITVHCRANEVLDRLNVNLRIRNKEGVKIYSWGTLNQDMAIWAGLSDRAVFWDRLFQSGEEFSVEFEFDSPLGTNFYEVQASVSQELDRFYGDQRMLHWLDEAGFFQVVVKAREYAFGGVADMRMRASW